MTGTGSDRKCGGHVFWDGKPRTSGKKGIAGSGNRKSRVFGMRNRGPVVKKGSRAQGTGSHVFWHGKPRTSGEKGIVGSGKTAEERGRKVQSPIFAARVILKTTQEN